MKYFILGLTALFSVSIIAAEPENCVVSERPSYTITQCPDGTVTTVTGETITVCAKSEKDGVTCTQISVDKK